MTVATVMAGHSIPGGFQAPFHHDGYWYIYDARGRIAADFRGLGSGWDDDGQTFHPVLQARGWGGLAYREDCEEQFLAWKQWLLDVADGSNDPDEVIQRLNNYTKDTP